MMKRSERVTLTNMCMIKNNDKILVSALPEYISLAMAHEMTAPAPPVNP